MERLFGTTAHQHIIGVEMKRSLLCLLLLSASLISLQAQTGEVPAGYTKAINTWIAQDNAQTMPADAPYAEVDGRVEIHAGDLDADGDDDYLALYGVTFGGNSLSQYMTAFINDNGTLSTAYKEEVGATGASMIDSVRIIRGTIECTTVIWRPDDGGCYRYENIRMLLVGMQGTWSF